jgi:hypothetical protein
MEIKGIFYSQKGEKMERKDVKVGMKVVPHAKTIEGWGIFSGSSAWQEAQEKNQPFLYVNDYDFDEDDSDVVKQSFVLDSCEGYGGDFYNAEDFELYID